MKMLLGWRQQPVPRTVDAVIRRQKIRDSCRGVHCELHSGLLPSRLQPISFPGHLATPNWRQRKIRNNSTSVDVSEISNGDKFDNDRSRTFQSKANDPKRVLIVGGGPSGLFLAHLLRSYNVPFRLIEAQTPEERFKHPQAHFLNTRTMEILKHGLSYNASSKPNHQNEIYNERRSAMPPVEEWKSFRFGPSMTSSSEKGTGMAEVIHPVDRPLAAESDANGVLVIKNIDGDKKVAEKKNKNAYVPLSSESVGHLAQHKFCRILYDALTNTSEKAGAITDRTSSNLDASNILYGRSVTGFDWNEEAGRWTIKTDQEEVFDDVDIILAADGAASTVRQNLFPSGANNSYGNDSTMLGTPNIQRLINVHFEIPGESARCEGGTENEHPRIPPAMLYTVFHPEVLAMVVRHGPGEYVLQIPYFDPYQTPEEDFSIPKVRKMVRSILGNTDDFTIHSVRPWTMGALVAQSYYTDEGVFLVGDAAHVFPPAGGFGMNTGLQDTFSLAWRIALHRQHKQEQQSNKNERTSLWSSLSMMGRMYERERQPVARRNAALSVRNYRRVLNVMRACYLDDRHPALLIQALDATASFIPLEIRRKTFRTLLQTALSPLSKLQSSPNGIYAKTIKSNLRALLGSGQGLPLLFPRHELDFSYDRSSRNNRDENEADGWSEDSVASSPMLALGELFPHLVASVSLETFRRFPRLHPIEDDVEIYSGYDDDWLITSGVGESSMNISTRDLAAQLATNQTPCAFCLLEIVGFNGNTSNAHSKSTIDDTLSSLKMNLEEKFGFLFLMSRLVISRNCAGGGIQPNRSYHEDAAHGSICDIYVGDCQWDTLNHFPALKRSSFDNKLFVVIRPDGHVAAISSKCDHANNLISGIHQSLMEE